MPRPNKIWFRKDTGWWMVTIASKKVRLAQGRKNKKAAEQKFHELMLTRHQNPDAGDPRVVDLVEAFLVYSEKRFPERTNGFQADPRMLVVDGIGQKFDSGSNVERLQLVRFGIG